MLNPFTALGVNRPYRTQAEAAAMIGKEITILGQRYRVTGHNDLGCLYGVKLDGKRAGKREYVID